MYIKKTYSQSGKKYSVIIKAEENIVEGKEYPAIFKEVKMNNKAPTWFVEFANKQDEFHKEIISRLDNLEKDMKQVKHDIVLIKNCSTIKAELQHSK